MDIFDHQTLWKTPEHIERYQLMLRGERLRDIAEEAAFLDAALLSLKSAGQTDFIPESASRYELLQQMLEIFGSTPAGKEYVASKGADFVQDILASGFGERDNEQLYSAEMIRISLLSLVDDPAAERFSAEVRSQISQFMTSERLQRVMALIDAGAFDPGIDAPTLDKIRSQILPQPKEAPQPDPLTGLPYLSDESLHEQIGVLSEKAERDARAFRLFQDAQVLAQMEWNAIMREQMDLTERTILNKIRDKIAHGITDFGNPITYPSESVFSHSLARMDSNGRVVETYLNFKRGLVGPRVEFPRAEVPEHVYKLAALNVRMRGVSKPHINTTFRNPQQAILFMQQSVTALLGAGYHIDDISVAPHLKTAFEAFKADGLGVQFSITEAAEPDHLNTLPAADPIPLMPEEALAVQNARLNQPLQSLSDAMRDQGDEIDLDDFSREQILAAITAISQSGLDDQKSWQEMLSSEGLSPMSWDAAKKLHAAIERLFNKFEKAHPDYAPDSVSNQHIDLLMDMGPVVLQELFGPERLGGAYPALQERAAAYHAEVAKLQLHEKQVPHESVADDNDLSETRGLQMEDPDVAHMQSVNDYLETQLSELENELELSPAPVEESPGYHELGDIFSMNGNDAPPLDETDAESISQLVSAYQAGPDHQEHQSTMTEPSLVHAPVAYHSDSGKWVSLPPERQEAMMASTWTDLSDDDIRWALSLSVRDLTLMQRGANASEQTAQTADKLKTIRSFLSPLNIDIHENALSDTEKQLIRRLPQDILAESSDELRELHLRLCGNEPNQEKTIQRPRP